MCTSSDRVRGLAFNGIARHIEARLGEGSSASLPGAGRRDLVAYPAGDYLDFLYAAASLLKPTSTPSRSQPQVFCSSVYSAWQGARLAYCSAPTRAMPLSSATASARSFPTKPASRAE